MPFQFPSVTGMATCMILPECPTGGVLREGQYSWNHSCCFPGGEVCHQHQRPFSLWWLWHWHSQQPYEACRRFTLHLIPLRPSKGFERQATLRQNVATICYQSTDSRQKLKRKKRQFAKTTIHFSFRQSDNCTFFLRRRHGCHDLTRPA